MADFELDGYISEENRYGVNIREALLNKFEPWLWEATPRLPEATPRLPERVFAVSGPFGIGKTWFLRYIAAGAAKETNFSRALCRAYAAQYIDWREAFAQGTTRRAFVSQKKRAIEAASQPLCLCVDNIPGRDGACEDLSAFEEVLYQALERGAFLVLAQEHPRYRGWSHKIPAVGTEPYILGEFTREGAAALPGPKQDTYELTLGHPYLIHLLAEHPYPEACHILIQDWLKDRDLLQDREKILEVAYPLSLIPPSAPDWPKKKHDAWRVAAKQPAPSEPSEWDTILSLKLVEKLQWLTFKEHEGKTPRYPLWYSPIQRCLQERLKEEKPELYRELQSTLQGGPG